MLPPLQGIGLKSLAAIADWLIRSIRFRPACGRPLREAIVLARNVVGKSKKTGVEGLII